MRQRVDPSPADIANACRRYQATWSPNDRLERLGQRRGKHSTPGVPVVRINRNGRVLRKFATLWGDEQP